MTHCQYLFYREQLKGLEEEKVNEGFFSELIRIVEKREQRGGGLV
jgi:hypothetical protein